MYRTRQSPRAGFSFAAITTFSLVALTACELRKDETGGRPVETSTSAPPTASVVEPQPVVTVGNPGVRTTPVSLRQDQPTDEWFKDADAAFRARRYDDATLLFGQYVKERPDNPWGHYMLGLSAWKYGDLDQARGAFEQALVLDKKHVKSLLNLTRVYLELGQPKEARARVVTALKLDSTSGEVHRLMGRVHAELKQHDEAIVSYRLALSHDPRDVWSMNNLALILIQQRRFTDALGPLALAVKLDSSVAVFQNNLGIALEHVGQYTLATAAYTGAVAADSNYTKAVMSLARVNGRKEDPALAPVDLVTIASAFERDVRTQPVAVAVVKKEQ